MNTKENEVSLNNKRIKVNFVGNTMVGKTSILNRMRFGIFNKESTATIGGSFVSLKSGNINYDIWDTAGQERFLSLVPMYFREVRISIFVFDVTNIKTVKYINRYKDVYLDDPNIIIIAIGNKIDLLKKNDASNYDNILKELHNEVYNNFEILTLTEKLHGLHFISTKKGENFDKFLTHLDESAENLPLITMNSKIVIDNPFFKKMEEDEQKEQNSSRCC